MQIKIVHSTDKIFSKTLSEIINKNSAADPSIEAAVSQIIADVKKQGDQKLIEICNKFDGANFKKASDLLVSAKEISDAKKRLDPEILKALKLSYKRIADYHKKQMPKDFSYQDNLGITLGNKWKAIETIAVYAPGGTALYPSSVLMSAVPAIIAGVKNIILTTPSSSGKINDAVLVAADLCKIKNIYKVGGAAAVAAVTFGTQTITKADKIVGPGNSFVALAKKQLFGEIGIDMIAGPTDILVISHNKSNPDWIAADMLSQLEHGQDSKAILITDDSKFANLVNNSLSKLVKNLERLNIIKESVKNSAILVVHNLEKEAADIANKIAPEHLEIITANPKKIANKIKNAGAIFLGEYSPEAIGDYIAGPSHTLPTMGTARFSSGLSVFDFLKRISLISCSKNGFHKLQKSAATLAKAENLTAHELSIRIRHK